MPTLLAAGAGGCLWMAAVPFAAGSTTGLVLIIAADSALLLCAGVFSPAFATYRMQVTADGYLARVTAAWAVSSKIAPTRRHRCRCLAAAALGARASLFVLAAVLLASIVLLPWKTWTSGTDAAALPSPPAEGTQR